MTPNDTTRSDTEYTKLKIEILFKHLEYHDSNVFKALSIFFVLAGLFLVNIEKFSASIGASVALQIVVGSGFFLLFLRTSEIINKLKEEINE